VSVSHEKSLFASAGVTATADEPPELHPHDVAADEIEAQPLAVRGGDQLALRPLDRSRRARIA
jgi:hypothetical protein